MEEAAWSWPWRMVNLDKYPRSQLSLEETQTETVPLCKWKVSEQSQPCWLTCPLPALLLPPRGHSTGIVEMAWLSQRWDCNWEEGERSHGSMALTCAAVSCPPQHPCPCWAQRQVQSTGTLFQQAPTP